MGGRSGNLTAAKVEALKTAAQKSNPTRRYYGDGSGSGLYLQISPNGASWVFRYRSRTESDGKGRGKMREMGLGSAFTRSLSTAREKARSQRELLLDGVDPLSERKATREAAALAAAKTISFKQCAAQYIEAMRHGWKNAKHSAQWSATLETYAYPHIGDLPVQFVDLGLVLAALEPIWKTKSATASRVRGRIEAILDWATTRGHRTGENPARWKGHLENLLPRPSKLRQAVHHAALPYAEIGTFVAELRQQESVAARSLEFLILTASRTSEARAAKWDEIDTAKRVWTRPASRMKSGVEHRVTLSGAALVLIEKMQATRSGDFIFPGAKDNAPISSMTMNMLLRRMGRADVTVHGMRSAFRTWAAERTNFPREVAEVALAHLVGSEVERAYMRGDLLKKRFQLAEAWGAFCAMPATTGGAVVPMRKGA